MSTPAVVEAERRLAEAEAKLAAVRAELAQGERLAWLGTLTAMVAHEVRNALTPIVSRCALARRPDVGRAELERAVALSLASAERANAAMEAVLALGRGVPGEARCVPGEVLEALAGRVEGLEVEVRSRRAVGMAAAALECVVENLFLNARRASGGGVVRAVVGEEGVAVVVEVRDSGPGLPAGMGAGSGGGGRVGLGLLVCRRLVEEAGGELRFGGGGGGGVVGVVLPGRE